MVSGKTLWAQGYSEPGAGSDLSNVRTKARLENDKWIIDGQKIWTSWKVAMGLLAFERGVGTLGQLTAFQREFDAMIELAKENGTAQDPLIRQRIGEAFTGLKVMRHSSLRMLSDESASLQPAAMTYKLYWSAWHKSFTELCLDVAGLSSFTMEGDDYDLPQMPYIYLTARADSIYGGTNQIQRNIVSEHALGMPREPRGKS